MSQKHIFGPVPSRRLGFSLGVDILPLKTCTYNCVYCQLFQTSNQLIKRQSFVDREIVLQEIKTFLDNRQVIDYITFSGSGEPTLNKDIGWLIDNVKSFTNIPIAVITNSTLLYMPEVRNDIKNADLVIPSLDAISKDLWEKINKPPPEMDFESVLSGLKTFCNEFKNKIYLEVFFVDGINNTPDEIAKIAEFTNSLQVDKVQINTVVRPPNIPGTQAISEKQLNEIQASFTQECEIIAEFKKSYKAEHFENLTGRIIDLLTRRPCKIKEMADALGVNINEVSKSIGILESDEKISLESTGHYSLKH